MSENNDTEDISVETAMALYKAALDEAEAVAGDQSNSEKSNALVVSTESPEIVKQRLINSRLAIASAQKKVRETKERLEVSINAQRAEMDRKLAEMNAVMEPLKKQMFRLADGIDAMNLYMGRDEFIVTIREGEKAPKESPIVIRQRVLAMDEEAALDALNGGIDAMDIEKFDAWLLSDPKHVQQVIPEEKSVVVLRVRASEKNYEDPWQAIAMNAANKETWWLIRNGENLYRMVTEFEVGTNLVPQSDEFTKLFETGDHFGRASEALKPGTDAWLKAEQRADAKTRHYMKIALILQGIVDRTEVFRPLPVEGLSVIDNHYYDEGYVRVITDSELAIDSHMKPFREWLSEKNSKVSVGTRIILGKVGHNTKDYYCISPRHASAPFLHVPYIVKEKSGMQLVIKYPRTDTVWGTGWRDEPHTAKTSASYSFYGSDPEYIAIDHVTIAEMEGYLAARSQRHNYTDMFPVLNAAIAFKRDEIEQEAPFRELLANELVKAGYPDSVDDLIFWWKTAHKWNRPFIGDQESEAKAARVILAEAKRRNAASDDDSIIEKFHTSYPDAMAVMRGNTNYVVFIPEVYGVAPYRSSDNVFVRRIDLTKTGIVKGDQRWAVITKSQTARLTALYSTDKWDSWNIGADADNFLSEPDYIELVDVARDYVAERFGKKPAVVTVTDFGVGWNSDYASIEVTVEHESVDIDTPIRLSAGMDSLTSKEHAIRINKKNGVATLNSGYNGDRYYVHTTDGWWRAKHNSFIDPTKDSGNLTAPWEDSNQRNAIVWKDEELIAREHAFADRYKKRSIEFAYLDAKADRLLDGIEAAWFDEYEKKMYARFIEDFGDDAMWDEYREGKRKSTKFPYPEATQKYSHSRSRVNKEDTLRWLVVRLVETGNAPYNLTVEEAYNGAQLLLTNVAKIELPEDIRSLRFLPEESNEIVKA